MKTLALIFVAVALTGCATSEYREYADAQSQIHVARANADKARYEALATVEPNPAATLRELRL